MGYPVFPALPGMEFPVQRAPVASTLRQIAISGRQTFQPLWAAPLYRYEVSFSLLRAADAFAEWQALAGFWNAVMFAPGGVFAFVDPNDASVTDEATGVGDGSTSEIQLVRALGGFAEPVFGPLQQPTSASTVIDYGNCTVTATAVLDYGNCTIAATADLDYGYCSTLQVFVAGLLAPYTLSAVGVVTIVPAPSDGAAITWTGSYAWLCRFDQDSLEFSNFMHLFWEVKKCAFTTVRP